MGPARSLGLLDLDRGPCRLEGGLGLVGVVLVDLLEDRSRGLRRALDQVLGFLQPQAGQGPDFLDHLDLLVAGAGQDDVELRLLLLDASSGVAAGGGCRRGYGNRCRGRHAEALLKILQQLAQLDHRELGDPIEDLVLCQGPCHLNGLPFFPSVLSGRSWGGYSEASASAGASASAAGSASAGASASAAGSASAGASASAADSASASAATSGS